MTKSSCKTKQKVLELIKKSNDVKIELDKTPYQDKKKFKSLLRKLLEVYKDMDEISE